MEPTADDRPTQSLLLVRLDQEIYGVPSSQIREVARHREPTPVPGAPPSLPGILNQRGTILPVVDPRLILGLAQSPLTRASRLVVAVSDDVEMALLVDGVLDIVDIPSDTLEPVPGALDPARGRMLRGVARFGEHPVIMLDLGELVSSLRDWS